MGDKVKGKIVGYSEVALSGTTATIVKFNIEYTKFTDAIINGTYYVSTSIIDDFATKQDFEDWIGRNIKHQCDNFAREYIGVAQIKP